jgi:hypothetical protein
MIVANKSAPIWPGLAMLTILFGLFVGMTVVGGRGLLYRARPATGCVAVLEQLDNFAAWYSATGRAGGSLATPRVEPGAVEAYIAAATDLDVYRRWWQAATGTNRVPTPAELQDRRWLDQYLDQVC